MGVFGFWCVMIHWSGSQVDKEALDLQVIEKLRRKAELKNQEDAHSE